MANFQFISQEAKRLRIEAIHRDLEREHIRRENRKVLGFCLGLFLAGLTLLGVLV